MYSLLTNYSILKCHFKSSFLNFWLCFENDTIKITKPYTPRSEIALRISSSLTPGFKSSCFNHSANHLQTPLASYSTRYLNYPSLAFAASSCTHYNFFSSTYLREHYRCPSWVRCEGSAVGGSLLEVWWLRAPAVTCCQALGWCQLAVFPPTLNKRLLLTNLLLL